MSIFHRKKKNLLPAPSSSVEVLRREMSEKDTNFAVSLLCQFCLFSFVTSEEGRKGFGIYSVGFSTADDDSRGRKARTTLQKRMVISLKGEKMMSSNLPLFFDWVQNPDRAEDRIGIGGFVYRDEGTEEEEFYLGKA